MGGSLPAHRDPAHPRGPGGRRGTPAIGPAEPWRAPRPPWETPRPEDRDDHERPGACRRARPDRRRARPGPRPCLHRRDHHPAQRHDRDPPPGPPAAAGRDQHLVRGRLQGRGAGAQRLRAPVRAPDVHGHAPRAGEPVRRADGVGRRGQQRLDQQRQDELLLVGPIVGPADAAVARRRPPGAARRRDDAAEARPAARRRPQRAAPDGGKRALRDRRADPARRRCTRRATPTTTR